VSIQPASAAVAAVPSSPVAGAEDALEFVRFCYRRRRVGWPALYDEMSAVAARGAFRGLGYGELAELGISFCLADLPRLVALTERVAREEQPISEPRAAGLTISLSPAQS
jgi:hypothetical protein